MHSTLMIFIDGIGFGKADPDVNPFFRYPFDSFKKVFGRTPDIDHQNLSSNGIYLFPSDPLMGVEGLPQSGTGQTSIFCGVNAPALIGQHFGPYPYSTLVPVIKEKNVFREFLNREKKAGFVNAYPKIFFDYIDSGKTRLSATSLSCILSGLRLNRASDLRKGTALSAEIDNSRWVYKLNYKLPVIKPETAAARLLRIASKNHFTLFEFFLTDHLGHGRIADSMEHVLKTLDRFLFHVLRSLDRENMTLIVCSDHGNLEDISVKSHTFNPAITITAGKYAEHLSRRIKDLSDIKPSVLELYD